MTMRMSRQALLDGLRAFSVAARQLSFKAAADALFLTPSAVSHRIRDLEGHLGQRLFVRKTRAIELTDAGRALLADVEPLLASLDAAVERATRRATRRLLRIAAPPFLSAELLIPGLPSLYGMQPRLDVQILSSDPHPTEHMAAADASIIIASAPPDGLTSTLLFAPRFVAATARPLALVAREEGRRLFERQRRIVWNTRSDLWASWFAATGYAQGGARGVLEVDQLPGVISAAERGLGIAMVPTFVCERRLRAGRLLRITDNEIEPGDAYYLVYRPEARSRPEIRALTSWALTELRR
jgi:LysR family glycine cleavage system transcriptional activator